MEKGAVFLGILLIIGGIVLIACSLITETYPHTYTEPYTYTQKIEGVPKTETLVEHGFSQGGGWQHWSFNLAIGNTVSIYYETGSDFGGPLFFLILNQSKYEEWPDGQWSPSEYAIAHGSNQIENWNWTVPKNGTWHFIFDFRQTFREDVYIKLTKYWIGTDYRDVTDYREITEYLTRPLIPSYCSYLGIILCVAGIGILVYRLKVHAG